MQKASDQSLFKSPLLYYIRNNPRAFSLGMFFLLITNALDGVYPLIMKAAIDQIEARENLPARG